MHSGGGRGSVDSKTETHGMAGSIQIRFHAFPDCRAGLNNGHNWTQLNFLFHLFRFLFSEFNRFIN